MKWLAKSLNRKFIVGTAVGLAVSSLTFLLLYMQLYKSEIGEERSRTASQVNSMLQTSLENAMLKRDLPGLADIINKLGQQPEIVSVFITKPTGEIRFSSTPEQVGNQLEEPYQDTVASTDFIKDAQGNEILRSINPVHNKEACFECHGPISKSPINGILYVDYDAAPLRKKVRDTTLLLMGAGATIVILNLLGGWWFIRQYVLKPVDQLMQTSKALTHGDYEARVELQGSDELPTLGHSFNFMAEKLEEKIQELKEQKSFLQGLVDAIPDGIRVINPDYNVILANEAYRTQHGMQNESGVGQPCYLITHNSNKHCPPTLITCPVYEILKNEKPIKFVHQHRRTDGSTFDVEIFAAPMRATIQGKDETLIVESIRDLVKQVKYSQEQKLSELGRLATGVAHEIHNPLASVKLALDATEKTIENKPDCPASIINNLDLVNDQINNCIEITGKLLKFGALSGDTPELVDINQAVSETLSLLKWQAQEENIVIHKKLDSSLLRVLASESEIRMVILNLVQNSFHAMPSGGELTLITSSTNELVIIKCVDTGMGIKQEDLPYIFDPFFSRRADHHKGTGLGLSISLAIVEKFGGTITVESELNSGSTFTVSLTNVNHSLGN